MTPGFKPFTEIFYVYYQEIISPLTNGEIEHGKRDLIIKAVCKTRTEYRLGRQMKKIPIENADG